MIAIIVGNYFLGASRTNSLITKNQTQVSNEACTGNGCTSSPQPSFSPNVQKIKSTSKTDNWKVFSNATYSIKYPSDWNIYSTGYISPRKECVNCGGQNQGFDSNLTLYITSNDQLLNIAKDRVKKNSSGFAADAIENTSISLYMTDNNLEIAIINWGICGNICVDDVLVRTIGDKKVYLIGLALYGTEVTDTDLLSTFKFN